MKTTKDQTSNFENGQHRIAQILKEFEMGCDEAIIRREGKRLILEPKKRLSSISKGLNPLTSSSMSVDMTLLGTW